jgi:DNA mismatch repair protein MutL
MSKEDLQESFKLHTTSKISKDEDLEKIKTFGFRGEALSSIAAISDLTIKSRQKNKPAGNMIFIKAGKLIESSPVGMPVGTQITISNLFYPVPARKKFLKNQKTEFQFILEIVSKLAIAHSKIHFVLTHNDREIFNLPKQTLSQRFSQLLDEDLSTHYLPIKLNESYINFEGQLAPPQLSSLSTQKQFIFINNRPVSDRLISSSVKEAFGNLLDHSSHPQFILFFKLPYELVDVNVHPRKEQVSFSNSQMIYDAVFNAVSKALQENNLMFQNLNKKQNLLPNISDKKITKSFAGTILKNNVNFTKLLQEDTKVRIMQLNNLYLIISTKMGLVLVDQHAAHERILYEQFLDEFKKQKNKKQILNEPLKIDLSKTDAQILADNLDLFFKAGIEVSPFGSNTFLVRAIPKLFKDRDIKILVKELIDQIGEGSFRTVDKQSEIMLKFLACRSAVMAGEPLTSEQIKNIVMELEKTPNNATCPHGRPTKIEISLEQLNKAFKR